MDKAKSGSRLVKDASATIGEIVASVPRASDIIGEITAAFSEQNQGIGQVNTRESARQMGRRPQTGRKPAANRPQRFIFGYAALREHWLLAP